MELRTYIAAQAFLQNTQAELESSEAANSLMLGICTWLARYPERIAAAPCLKTVHDENGLVLAAVMTPPQNLVVYGHQGDVDAGARALAVDLVGEGWPVPGVLGPAGAAGLVAERLAEAAGRSSRLADRQQVYELRDVLTQPPEQGRLRLATETESGLVARWWAGFGLERLGRADLDQARETVRLRIADGDLYVWDDGGPVSMAVRTRPTNKGISIGPVYTPPELRRRGYATACVGELSRLLLAAGREFCALFVDRANPTAARIYQRLGYYSVADYDEYLLT